MSWSLLRSSLNPALNRGDVILVELKTCVLVETPLRLRVARSARRFPGAGAFKWILLGQSPADFFAHAAAIAYDLGMSGVRVVPVDPSVIRLELLPHDRLPGPPSR